MRILKYLLGIAVLLASVFFIFESLPEADFSLFFSEDHLVLAGGFFLLFCVATCLRGLRFAVIASQDRQSLFWPAFRLFPMLFMISAVTPFRLGEGARIAWMQRVASDGWTGLSSLIVERSLDALILILLFGLGGLLSGFGIDANPNWMGFLILGILLGTCMLAGVTRHVPRIRSLAMQFLPRFLFDFLDNLGALANRKLLMKVVTTSIAAWLLLLGGFWWVIDSTATGGIDWPAAGFALACANLVFLVSPVPGNIGTYQAAVIAALAAYGVGEAEALLAGIILQGSNLAAMFTMAGASFISSSIHDDERFKASF